MKIWLCKHSEPLPIEKNSRLYRVGMISESLQKNNHEVVWWTSDFNHAKKNRYKNIGNLLNGTSLNLSHGIAYEKNISLKRIINHHQIGVEFTKNMNKSELPDLIYATIPTLDYAYRAVKFAKKNSIPVIIDILDLWPDVFLDIIPLEMLKKNWLFFLSNKKLRYILENADFIIGITEEYLEWGLEKINLKMNKEKHKIFPIGYKRELNTLINKNNNDNLKIIFTGTIGYHFDLNTVLEAAVLLENENIEFNILGDGDLLERYLEKYSGYKNINFLGWIEGELMYSYLSRSDIGIAPYKNTKNFLLNIPNKPYEYMAYNLPVLTCLRGATKIFLEKHDTGYFYKESDARDLAKEILDIKNNRDLLNIKKRNSESAFMKNYNADFIYENFVRFIENI